MADSCAELRAAIARLEAKIDAIPRVDEQSIIQKAIKGAESLLKPEIVVVGGVAGQALGQAGIAGGLATEASALAGSALAALGSLGAQILAVGATVAGLIVRFAGLIGLVLSLIATVASYFILQTQINALQAEVKALREYVNAAFRQANAAMEVANAATLSANEANFKADALFAAQRQIVETLNRTTALANATVGKANQAIFDASVANSKANEAIEQSNASVGLANLAILTANGAAGKANTAVQAADIAVGKANTAVQAADIAVGKANVATFKADTAVGRANTAIQDADIAVGRANVATLKADTASNLATTANTKADIALPTAINANFKADLALNRPPGGLTINPGTGTTRTDAELNRFVNTQIREAAGTNAAAAAAEQLRQQQTLVETVTNNVNGTVGQIRRDITELQRRIVSPQSITNTVQNTVQNVTNTIQNNVTNIQQQIAAAPGISTNFQAQINTLGNRIRESEILNERGLAGIGVLGGLIANLPSRIATNPAVNAANRAAARAGTCDTAQPGGCLGTPLGRQNGKLDDLLRKADLGLQAGQGALLASMNSTLGGISNVLGTKIHVGGVSGALGRFMSSSIVDRTISLVIMAGVVHNCTMLSSSIGETFFSILDNIFAIPQLIKDPDAATIDTKAVFTGAMDNYFKVLFGAKEYETIKAQWKAYSTIYSTGANMFGQVRDLVQETGEIQQTTANWVAELGNALVNEGSIGEENWDIKDEDQKPRGKHFGRLARIAEGIEQVENVFEDLEQISQSARSIVETANELKANTAVIKTELDKANNKAKEDRDLKEEGIELPNFSLDDLY